jgi:hypothetical protein
MIELEVGRYYTRTEVAQKIGLLPGKAQGNWDTGYARVGDDVFIFANVGTAGRTGHDYHNRWDGKCLIWFGRTGSRLEQPLIAEMVSGHLTTHVLWRSADRSPFTYAGRGRAIAVRDVSPVEVTWSFDSNRFNDDPITAFGQQAQWRRGPMPAHGMKTIVSLDGPTYFYVMQLYGQLSSILPDVSPAEMIIKIGISNDYVRREAELNNGFPPGSLIAWRVIQTWLLESAKDAFLVEGRCLERLRLEGKLLGGEYAKVTTQYLEDELNRVSAELGHFTSEARNNHQV